jgi:hypothetical protein
VKFTGQTNAWIGIGDGWPALSFSLPQSVGCPISRSFFARCGIPRTSTLFSELRKTHVERCGIPHLAKNERDTPNFLHAAPDMTACAAFIKESHMDFANAHKLHSKSRIWGTPRFVEGKDR